MFLTLPRCYDLALKSARLAAASRLQPKARPDRRLDHYLVERKPVINFKLSAIARQLNERPWMTSLYQTPADKFAECVQRPVEPGIKEDIGQRPDCACFTPTNGRG